MAARPKPRPPARARGPLYDPDLFIPEILDWCTDGLTLDSYCQQDGKPSWRLVHAWRRKRPEFKEQLADAREDGYDAMAERLIRIADGEDFKPFADPKLRIDTVLRLLGKWSKRYSDKTQVENTGSSTVQVITGVPDPETTKSNLLT
jgi:hypothetical protein